MSNHAGDTERQSFLFHQDLSSSSATTAENPTKKAGGTLEEQEKETFLSPNGTPLEIVVPPLSIVAADTEKGSTNITRGKVVFLLLLIVLLGGTTTTMTSHFFKRARSNHDNQQKIQSTSDSDPDHSSSCTWAPGNNTDCLDAIQSLVCQQQNTEYDRNKIPRLLLFGDSTMDRLFIWGGIRENLVSLDKKHMLRDTGLVKCKVRNGERCHLNEQFGYHFDDDENSFEWTWPNISDKFWGPLEYGILHPFCQDCRGCSPTKIDCIPLEKPTGSWDIVASSLTTLNEQKRLVYGGYMGIEYARDVELQSNQFRWTQENVAHYIGQTWNAPALLRVWQKPTCLVNAGHHDVKIPGITVDDYVANVKWYLHLLADKCRHILWLSTTSPRSDNPIYVQTVNGTGAWGYAVYDMMKGDPLLNNKSLCINVFEASRTFKHHDNIHMDKEWYERLGTLFQEETFLNCP